jgi:hypothetical protein
MVGDVIVSCKVEVNRAKWGLSRLYDWVWYADVDVGRKI